MRQINYQNLRIFALLEPEVVKELSETKEQLDKIKAIFEEYQAKIRELFRPGGNSRDPQGDGSAMERIDKERDAKAIEQLTQDQKSRFDALKGKEFDIRPLNPFGGQVVGGGRGRGTAGTDGTAPKRPQQKPE